MSQPKDFSSQVASEVFLGIDIGGTKIAIGLALGASDASPLSQAVRFPARVEEGPDAMIAHMVSEAKLLLGGRVPARIGVSCGGPLDRVSGRILSPPNLPGWDRVPLVERLVASFGAPVRLDNDANLAALGEQRFGAARGRRDVLYVTVSTGIGGGILRDGELVHGVGDAAGELGHQTVDRDGPLCGCGNRGCLEALASGTAIARIARESIAAQPERSHALREACGGDLAKLSAATVAEVAAGGDALASELWQRAVEWLGIGLANAITILAPEIVVLGGGVTAVGEPLLEGVRRVVAERVRLVPAGKFSIELAALGQDSPLVGALALARDPE